MPKPGRNAATEYACAAVVDYVNGDDVLGDLRRRMDDADDAGDEVGTYESIGTRSRKVPDFDCVTHSI